VTSLPIYLHDAKQTGLNTEATAVAKVLEDRIQAAELGGRTGPFQYTDDFEIGDGWVKLRSHGNITHRNFCEGAAVLYNAVQEAEEETGLELSVGFDSERGNPYVIVEVEGQ